MTEYRLKTHRVPLDKRGHSVIKKDKKEGSPSYMKDRTYASYAIDWEEEGEILHRTLIEARNPDEALELLEGSRIFPPMYEYYHVRKLR